MVRLCGTGELPGPGQMRAFALGQRSICVANDGGVLAAVDNVCPHRQGPLAEGSLENGRVLCPWHAWAFDLVTGITEHNPRETVEVFRLEIRGADVLVEPKASGS